MESRPEMGRFTTLKTKVFVAAAAVALGMVTLTVTMVSASSPPASSPSADLGASSDNPVLAAVDSSRLATLDSGPDGVRVTGTASKSGDDETRTFWYESLAGAAYAQEVKADTVNTVILDASGATLDSETAPLNSAGSDAFPSAVMTESDLTTMVQKGAASVDAQVVDIHYIPLFGGTAEIVLQPSDVKDFVANASIKSPSVLGTLARQGEPYLLTVVDAQGNVQMVLGYTPTIGEGLGEGIAWLPPGVQSDAVWGSYHSNT